mmetsp:Transcript_73183/g.174416  ORF Transcript_73183/g.174416 Transcript_73183/m.174416 type:complete len:418 (-) Transcript_73183:19-1272(-)
MDGLDMTVRTLRYDMSPLAFSEGATKSPASAPRSLPSVGVATFRGATIGTPRNDVLWLRSPRSVDSGSLDMTADSLRSSVRQGMRSPVVSLQQSSAQSQASASFTPDILHSFRSVPAAEKYSDGSPLALKLATLAMRSPRTSVALSSAQASTALGSGSFGSSPTSSYGLDAGKWGEMHTPVCYSTELQPVRQLTPMQEEDPPALVGLSKQAAHRGDESRPTANLPAALSVWPVGPQPKIMQAQPHVAHVGTKAGLPTLLRSPCGLTTTSVTSPQPAAPAVPQPGYQLGGINHGERELKASTVTADQTLGTPAAKPPQLAKSKLPKALGQSLHPVSQRLNRKEQELQRRRAKTVPAKKSHATLETSSSPSPAETERYITWNGVLLPSTVVEEALEESYWNGVGVTVAGAALAVGITML